MSTKQYDVYVQYTSEFRERVAADNIEDACSKAMIFIKDHAPTAYCDAGDFQIVKAEQV